MKELKSCLKSFNQCVLSKCTVGNQHSLKKSIIFESKLISFHRNQIEYESIYFSRQEFREYVRYTFYDCIKWLFFHNYTYMTFFFTYGAMWWFNIHLDTRFFAVACCILNMMRADLIDYFSSASGDLAEYWVAKKRIEV